MATMSENEPLRRHALPRGFIIVVGLAAGVVVLAGMREVSGIVGPILMALALVVTVYPLRTWLQAKGAPAWVAVPVVVLGVYAVLIALVVSFVWGLASFVTLLPTYGSQMQDTVDWIRATALDLGIGRDEVMQMVGVIEPAKIVQYSLVLLSGVWSIVSVLIFVIVLVLFLAVDSTKFTTRMPDVRGIRSQSITALESFAKGTRQYFAVATVFGAVVAVLDGIALWALGIPGVVLWTILAFVTNYIPNVGFILGLAPVAVIALLSGGVGKAIAIVVIYVVLNFVIQSVIQPKFVGDAVGLTTTISFLSLVLWSFVLGPLGAILAVPMTLLAKALLVDVDPDARWLQLFLGDQPDHRPRKERKAAKTAAELPDPA